MITPLDLTDRALAERLLTIQHAASMAYLGHKEEARAHISSMLGRPEYFQYRQRMIERALIDTPEGVTAVDCAVDSRRHTFVALPDGVEVGRAGTT